MFGRLSKIERAYRRYPSAPLFARFAETCLGQGDTERALAVCLEGCERFPDYPTGFYLLGRCYQALGELEEARSALDRSLRLDAENPRGFEMLAAVYADLGIATLALKCMEEAARLDPFDEVIAGRLQQLTAQEPPRPAPAELTEVLPVPAADDSSQEPPLEVAAVIAVERSPQAETLRDEDLRDEDLRDEDLRDEDLRDEDLRDEDLRDEDDENAPAGIETGKESVDDDDVAVAQIPEDVEPTAAEETKMPDSVPDLVLEPEPEPEIESEAAVSVPVDEPFGELRDLPEWEAETAAPEPAFVDDPAPRPASMPEPEPDSSDEVAALGAELFGDELPEPAAAVPPATASSPYPLPGPTEGSDSVSPDTGSRTGARGQEGSALSDDGDDVADDGDDALVETPVTPATVVAPAPAAQQPARASGIVEEETVDDTSRPVSRFSRHGDSDMIDLLREFDCTEDDRAADADLPTPIPTTTLAELYCVQGFVDRAIETYRQMLRAQPDNEAAKTRLTALEGKE